MKKKKNKKSLPKKIIKIVLRVLILVAALFAAVYVYFMLTLLGDYRAQEKRVENLSDKVVSTFSEQGNAAFSFSENPPINAIQYIASHNSYHVQPDFLRLFFVGLVEPDEPAAMKYSHTTLTEQLDAGVRSFELDLRVKEDHYEVVHVPLVGNRGHSPDFLLALEEISLWSRTHRNHAPVFILLELKSDYTFLDPALLDWDRNYVLGIDDVIREVFTEDRLLSPDDIRRPGKTLELSILEDGWPLLSEALGQVVFILHKESTYREWYTDGAASLEGRAMFTCAMPGQDDAAFILHNEADQQLLTNYVKAGYMVRTRVDANLVHNATRYNIALNSGAQLLTTDFPPNEPNEDGYRVEFDGAKTLRLNPFYELKSENDAE